MNDAVDAAVAQRSTRLSLSLLAAEAVRRWTVADGDPDFDGYAAGLFDYYGNGAWKGEMAGNAVVCEDSPRSFSARAPWA